MDRYIDISIEETNSKSFLSKKRSIKYPIPIAALVVGSVTNANWALWFLDFWHDISLDVSKTPWHFGVQIFFDEMTIEAWLVPGRGSV